MTDKINKLEAKLTEPLYKKRLEEILELPFFKTVIFDSAAKQKISAYAEILRQMVPDFSCLKGYLLSKKGSPAVWDARIWKNQCADHLLRSEPLPKEIYEEEHKKGFEIIGLWHVLGKSFTDPGSTRRNAELNLESALNFLPPHHRIESFYHLGNFRLASQPRRDGALAYIANDMPHAEKRQTVANLRFENGVPLISIEQYGFLAVKFAYNFTIDCEGNEDALVHYQFYAAGKGYGLVHNTLVDARLLKFNRDSACTLKDIADELLKNVFFQGKRLEENEELKYKLDQKNLARELRNEQPGSLPAIEIPKGLNLNYAAEKKLFTPQEVEKKVDRLIAVFTADAQTNYVPKQEAKETENKYQTAIQEMKKNLAEELKAEQQRSQKLNTTVITLQEKVKTAENELERSRELLKLEPVAIVVGDVSESEKIGEEQAESISQKLTERIGGFEAEKVRYDSEKKEEAKKIEGLEEKVSALQTQLKDMNETHAKEKQALAEEKQREVSALERTHTEEMQKSAKMSALEKQKLESMLKISAKPSRLLKFAAAAGFAIAAGMGSVALNYCSRAAENADEISYYAEENSRITEEIAEYKEYYKKMIKDLGSFQKDYQAMMKEVKDANDKARRYAGELEAAQADRQRITEQLADAEKKAQQAEEAETRCKDLTEKIRQAENSYNLLLDEVDHHKKTAEEAMKTKEETRTAEISKTKTFEAKTRAEEDSKTGYAVKTGSSGETNTAMPESKTKTADNAQKTNPLEEILSEIAAGEIAKAKGAAAKNGYNLDKSLDEARMPGILKAHYNLYCKSIEAVMKSGSAGKADGIIDAFKVYEENIMKASSNNKLIEQARNNALQKAIELREKYK
jgi:Skp family chaperone for outer membrane proteins